jgi:tetrahydromethanopterin S-methyltransferase subunit B
MDNGGRRNGGSRPVPDPTTLTTQALEREVANVRETIETFKEQLDRRHTADREWVTAQLDVVATRLDGIDTATDLRLRGIIEIPDQIDEKVANLEKIADEKFASIDNQFKERDTRSERESRDNKVAVDAAFAAQKEAAAKQDEGNQKNIDKSERSILESINKLSVLVDSQIKAMGDKIDDLKDRIGRVESVKIGVAEAKTGFSSNIGVVVMVATILLAAIAIIGFIASRSGPT